MGSPSPQKLSTSSQGGVFEGQIDQKWKNYHFFLKIKNSLMISFWDVNYGLVRIRGHRTTNGVTGDEGSSIQVAQNAQNVQNWENGQKWAKNNKKK